MTNSYDDFIEQAVGRNFPELNHQLGKQGWLLVKAQMQQESNGNPNAISPAGAKGLLQLMPETAAELGINDPFHAPSNIEAGVRYLATQYRKLHELQGSDRLCAALAAYNGGRGYINEAMRLGRQLGGQNGPYSKWVESGRPNGAWQTWPVLSRLLENPDCMRDGKRPDYKQMQGYVSAVMSYFSQLVVKG
ncbi:MAG: lytic transglycosylase domain-containing protein [Chloroflexia bacterium]|nr:lytic transglycosylase domain-containing protein [Chloroflexia bacterium]